ncbi:MAG TPA: hypothetical protein VKV26_23120 [Dehalococcoidia bacterium]|nr:hypothetical protein [Dehalococcoidia bacterium]
MNPATAGEVRSRRRFLRDVGGGTAAALLSAAGVACGKPANRADAAAARRATPRAANRQPVSALLGFAFGAAQQDVTLFDPVTRQALETRPLGATVTWLSNEQRFWDGRSIWTFDLPANQVEAIAIDPRTIALTQRIATGGRGPAHGLVLTPDRTTAYVNIAGDNAIAAIDLAAGEVSGRVDTGHFP